MRFVRLKLPLGGPMSIFRRLWSAVKAWAGPAFWQLVHILTGGKV